MAARNSGIKAKLTLDRREFKTELKGAENDLRSTARAVKAFPPLKLDAGNIKAFKKELDGMRGSLRGFGAGGSGGGGNFFAGWGKGLVAAGAAAAVFAKNMSAESLVKSLASVTSDAESLKTQLTELGKVAEKPGIDMEAAIQGSAALQAVGQSAAESRETLTQFANAVARSGGDVETFKGSLLAVRQILSKPVVQQEEVLQLLERIPEFGNIARQLEPLKEDPKKWMAGAVQALAELPRVASGARESLDSVKQAVNEMLTSRAGQAFTRGASAYLSWAGRGLSGKWSGNFDQLGQDLSRAGQSTTDRFDPGDTARAQRREAQLSQEEARKAEVVRKAREELRLTEAQLTMERDAAKLELAGDNEAARLLRENFELEKEIRKETRERGVAEGIIREELQAQLNLRREARELTGRKAAADAAADSAIEEQRARGNGRRANAMENERTRRARVQDLTGQGVTRQAAEAQAGREDRLRREQQRSERLGRPMRIRGAEYDNRPGGIDGLDYGDTALGFTPRNLDLNPTGGIGTRPRRYDTVNFKDGNLPTSHEAEAIRRQRDAVRGAASSVRNNPAAQNAPQNEVVGVLREIATNTRKTPAEATAPARSN